MKRSIVVFDSRTTRPGRRRAPRRGAAGRGVFYETDRYTTSVGATIVHEQQYFKALRVFRSSRVVTIRKGRRRATSALARLPLDLEIRPERSPSEAVLTALAFLHQRGAITRAAAPRLTREIRMAHLADQPAILDYSSVFAEPVRTHLEVFPQSGGAARLAWVLQLVLRNGARFQAVVSADVARAAVLWCVESNTRAFAATWVPIPGTNVTENFPTPPFATVDGGAGSASAWLAAAGFAGGPNVVCRTGANPAPRPLGPANVDNVFVWCNLLHDFYASFGFDGMNHAFELDDPLEAVIYDSPKKYAAEFRNHSDGYKPELYLYKSTFSGGQHAALDPSIVIHEYTHGVSSRLLGGASLDDPFASLESMGFNEGSSDFMALTILGWIARARGQAEPARIIGPLFKKGGYRDYRAFAGTLTPGLTDPYDIGQVWCAGLLAGRDAVAAATTADAADRFVWKAQIDCLKAMAPANPTTFTLTLKDIKVPFLAAATAIETSKPQMAGSAALINTALTNRGIA